MVAAEDFWPRISRIQRMKEIEPRTFREDPRKAILRNLQILSKDEMAGLIAVLEIDFRIALEGSAPSLPCIRTPGTDGAVPSKASSANGNSFREAL